VMQILPLHTVPTTKYTIVISELPNAVSALAVIRHPSNNGFSCPLLPRMTTVAFGKVWAMPFQIPWLHGTSLPS
jgi:hypothetical protein